MDLVQLVNDLEEGKFIQQSVDTVLRQQEGKQLLAEVIPKTRYVLIIKIYHLPGNFSAWRPTPDC